MSKQPGLNPPPRPEEREYRQYVERRSEPKQYAERPHLDPEYRYSAHSKLPSANGRDGSLLQQVTRARGGVDPGPENRIPLPQHNGGAAGGEARPHESHSSGSERSSSRYKQQQLQDRWKYDKQNPVFNNEEVAISPIRPYGAAQVRPSSPTPKSRSGVTASRHNPRPLDNGPPPSVPLVGALFNFAQPANLPPKYAAGGPPPPEMPAWNFERMYLTGRFLYNSACEERPPETTPLAKIPRQTQSEMIVDDLLNTFLGVDGRFIRAKVKKHTEGMHMMYTLDCDMDPSIRDMARRMLPLSEYAVVLERFVETRSVYGWGLVCHALAGALRSVLGDWHLHISQMEHQQLLGKLDLPTLWYYCQKPLESLRVAAIIAGEAASRKLRGAALLNLLHHHLAAVTGDVDATKLVKSLLEKACEPYFGMLELWLCQGVLNDPYSEFMVEEDKSVTRESENVERESAFWTDRYMVRQRQSPPGGAFAPSDTRADMPSFLSSCRDIILTTGKYLNIIRECGKEVKRPLPPDVHITYDTGQEYLNSIQEANKAASAALLHLMLEEVDLPEVLLALKHYFLLDRGDLLLSFLDSAEDEMAKPQQHVSLPRLQTLLDLAVRSSNGVAEPKGEELFCTIDTRRLQPMLHDLAPVKGGRKLKHPFTPLRRQSTGGHGGAGDDDVYALTTQLGREVFMLGFKVGWPMNVVVTRNSMNTYQLIFRHLFELKCVERELNKVWKIYQRARRISSKTEGSLKTAYGLCQRMMHFFHQYLLYVTFEVLEPHWLALQTALKAANSLDEVMMSHGKFLQRALAGTVLKSKMVRNLTDLKVLVYDFSKQSERLDVDAESLAETPQGKPRSETQKRKDKSQAVTSQMMDILSAGLFTDTVKDLDIRFSQSLANFITGLRDVYKAASSRPDSNREELESLLNLISRLDFNGYFAAASTHAQASALLGPLPKLGPRPI